MSKLIHNFFHCEKWPKIWGNAAIFFNRPMVENSPSLVTLFVSLGAQMDSIERERERKKETKKTKKKKEC
jgi:hypothetical protein